MAEFGNLPEETVIDILARLSVTSLGQCLFVCKSWCSLISDSFFINKQLCINRNRRRVDGDHHHYSYITYSDCYGIDYVHGNSSTYHSLRCQNTCREHKRILYPWLIGICTVTSSCNGVLCLIHRPEHTCNGVFCLIHRPQICSDYLSDIILWNPLIKKIKILPKPHFQTSPDFNESVAIGFIPQANECKVVRLNLARNWEVSSPQTIDIYSLRKDSWRTWTGEDIQWRFFSDTANESVNGSIYWKARKNVCDGDSQLIVSFNLADEVFTEISLPKYHRAYPNQEVGFISISVIYEKLAFSIARGSKTPYEEEVLEIWLLEESDDGESWTKFRNLIFATGKYKVSSWFMENGEFAVHDSWNNRTIVLDPDTQQIVAEHGSKCKKVNCTESLVLLNEGLDASTTALLKFATDFVNEKREACRETDEERRKEGEEEQLGIARRVINRVIGGMDVIEVMFLCLIMSLMAIYIFLFCFLIRVSSRE